MKRGNTREKRGAVLGIVLFGLIQLACVAGFWALCLIPDLPQWLFLLFFVWRVLRRADAPRSVGAEKTVPGAGCSGK